MLANKQNYHGSPNKPYQIQQKYINAPEHPRYSDINLKLEAIKQPDKYSHIRKKIIELFNENRKCYGYRRIHQELKRLGITISEKIVRDIMNYLKISWSCLKGKRNIVHIKVKSLLKLRM